MAPNASRRRFLMTVGAAAVSGVSGCAGRRRTADRLTVTPAPVPTDRPSPARNSPAPSPSPAPEVLAFEIQVRSGFDESSPARLSASLRNAGDTMLTALDGPRYTVPFVDDDYVGTDWTGDPELLLVPDDAELVVEPAGADPGPIQAFLPTSSADGCWSVPFEWPDARVASNLVFHAIPLPPGERRRHDYELYTLDGCVTGTFSFVNTFDLSVGDPPFGHDVVRARLGFDLALSGIHEPLVRVHDPVIGPSAEED